MVALLKYGLKISKIVILFELLPLKIFLSSNPLTCFLLLFGYLKAESRAVLWVDRHTDRQAEGWRVNLIESLRYGIFVSPVEK